MAYHLPHGSPGGWGGLTTLVLGLLVPAVAWPAAALDRQISTIYTPFRVELAALAPDGRHVAFAVHRERGIELQIHDTENPGEKIPVRLEHSPVAVITFLAWATADRLVAASDEQLIVAVNGETGQVRKLADARTFRDPTNDWPAPPRMRVLGFVDGEPDQLMVEVSADSAPSSVNLELHRLNLATGAHERILRKELAPPGGSLLADRQGRARIVLARDRIPQRFEYRPAEEKADWKNLDRVLAERAAFTFQITPANFLGERTIPLGFDPDPNILYYASNLGRDTYGLYAVDLRNGKRTSFVLEDQDFDLVDFDAPWLQPPLVFDRRSGALAGVRRNGPEPATRWFDPEIAREQAELAGRFPGRNVQLIEWDDARERFLVLLTTNSDPGRYFVHDRRADECVEYLRRAPALDPAGINPVEPFAFVTPAGARVSGYCTWPQAPAAPPALVVWLHDGPWQREKTGFNRDAQALAAMGFAVVSLNYAGSSGEGRAKRESIRQGYDRLPVEEMVFVLGQLGRSHAFDHTRVAVVGEGFGGYLALRALQLQPETFRCGVALNGLNDLAGLRQARAGGPDGLPRPGAGTHDVVWDAAASSAMAAAQNEAKAFQMINQPAIVADFDREFRRWFTTGGAAGSVLKDAGLLTRPVLLLGVPVKGISFPDELRARLKRDQRPVSFGDLAPDFAREGSPDRAVAFRRIGDYLARTLGGSTGENRASP